ncbi:hypothetical protein BC832DRAFT_527853 [Gaertneriomyces semiglobifer]|nr:hypothetical protein BC832DRAFT_527853 [Gaertneriomyces semiglobifer]
MANTHNSDTFLSRISARTGIPFTSDSPEVTGPVTLLGKAYPLITDAGCLEDFRSIIWVTYRKEYPCINGTSFSTDVGWGCMLRSGQMMVAEALKRFTLGRDWRLPSASDDSKQNDVEYAKIVSLFFDTPNAPLSIHHIATKGQLHDKKIGEWFGPMTISQVIKTLINDNLDISLKVHVASEGAVYTKELDFGQSGILVLIPVRLGLEGLNAVYYESIKACLGMKHCVGIAGGRPNSSLFFVGCSGDNLIYLDPHFLRPAIACKAPEAYTVNELESYQCTTPRTTPIDLVDPSMVLGFCFADEAEWEEFVSYSRKVSA